MFLRLGCLQVEEAMLSAVQFDIYLDSGEEEMMEAGYRLVKWSFTTDVTGLRLLTVSSS